MIQAISRRLDRLQERFIGGDEICSVKVVFKDGNTITVPYCDFTGFYDDDGTLHESEIEKRGWCGEIAALSCDNWRFSGVVALAAGFWGCEYVEP